MWLTTQGRRVKLTCELSAAIEGRRILATIFMSLVFLRHVGNDPLDYTVLRPA